MRRLNLIGERFSKLLVIDEAECHINPSGQRLTRWLCKCECGNEVKVRTTSLNSGNTKSCGCWHKDVHFKHGMIKDVVYKAWCSMIERCSNPNNPRYRAYGGRGIEVCKEWLKFENFYADMGNRPSGCSLDRINVNGNYEASNCRWATYKQQNRNRRNNKLIEFNGEVKCLSEWAECVGIKTHTLLFRLNAGWSIDSALTIPVRQRAGSGMRNNHAK